MKTYIYYLLIITSILTTVSCENELPFDFNNNPPKLVMNALIDTTHPENILYLNFTGKEYATNVQNATVEVRINGQLAESLRPLPIETEGDEQCRFKIISKFNPGDVVRIDALTDDGKYHAWSEVIVPQPLKEIEKIDTLSVEISKSGFTYDRLQYKITFNDRPKEDNYYRILVDLQISIPDYNFDTDETVMKIKHSYGFEAHDDIVLTDGHPSTGDDDDNGIFDNIENKYGVFDGSRFKNSSYTMTVYNNIRAPRYLQLPVNIEVDVIIHLLSITETEYYYLKALNLLESDSYDETINEPIRLPSNVNGGLGVIGISTETSKTIHFPDYWARY